MILSQNPVRHPVLIINGSNDVMAPIGSTVQLYSYLPNAQLILMPDSGHGVLFQFNELLLSQLNAFLDLY
jgi:pimeloyl-ACP methyl ester carboxylesterase